MTAKSERAAVATPLEALYLGTPGPDHLTATEDGQTLDGLGGDDYLESGYSDPTLLGGDGDDTLRSWLSIEDRLGWSYDVTQSGGDGDDDLGARFDFDGLDEGSALYSTLRLNGNAGNDVIDVALSLERFSSGGYYDIAILGGAGDDTVLLDFSMNRIGMRPPEVSRLALSGGSGNDMIGVRLRFTGDEDLRCVTSVDAGRGDDTVRLRTSASSLGDMDQTSWVYGQAGDDDIWVRQTAQPGFSATQHTFVWGGDGDDKIVASSAAPFARHRNVSHSLSGENGNDELRARIEVTSPLDGNQGYANGLYGGSGDDTLFAVITVALGFNTVSGGDGDDRIYVSGGNANQIRTGAGIDTFVIEPFAATGQRTRLLDFNGAVDRFEILGLSDLGAPGLVDDLDAIATFAPSGPGDLRVTIGALIIDVRGAPPNADSFADIVADPATQIFASDDAFA
ncbi:hypothetical protein [Amaricoccus sp.]|uniref:hypothetical protein n=1 Tax=Amaricoccus sp. TaxID=1872485 RepID=UPI001B76EC4F|nr:hypothetical protein [Amaricoccus sp.]MBP7000916.1 hypothetical protein [Amaricoccus sp.]